MDDVERLRFIRSARALEFSLTEIKEILDFREEGEAPCTHIAKLIPGKLSEIDSKITELRRLRKELGQLSTKADELSEKFIATEGCICHLIESNPRSA